MQRLEVSCAQKSYLLQFDSVENRGRSKKAEIHTYRGNTRINSKYGPLISAPSEKRKAEFLIRILLQLDAWMAIRGPLLCQYFGTVGIPGSKRWLSCG
jgi:hypothetical protein